MLSESTLKTELEKLLPTGVEATAVSRLASAWTTYFYEAGVAGTPCAGGTLAGAQAGMEGALVGMSATGQGAAKMQAGITAFWAQVALQGATVWPGSLAPYTPPPGLSLLSAALQAIFAANLAGGKDLSDAAEALASALHTGGGLGGVATMPGVPPLPTPIL